MQEGMTVLFKRLADIDVFDIELNTTDPERFIETVIMLEPTFGGINPENILIYDVNGLLHPQRTDLYDYQLPFARESKARNLAQGMKDADVFIGASAGGVLNLAKPGNDPLHEPLPDRFCPGYS